MSILNYIIIFTFIGSVLSLIGGIILLIKEKYILKISHLMISFAAGTLLGTAFFDLLPEASEESNNVDIYFWALGGILFFFLVERFIHWFHYHESPQEVKPTIPLIVIGDSIHNFIDGVVIASAFLVSVPLGIVTAIAVAAHEVPQEIGDFAILLHKGMAGKKVLLINILSALTSLSGALLTYFLRNTIEGILPIMLSITAGFFIYIALSDLIPEIHQEKRERYAVYETFLLFVGVLIVWTFITFLE